MKTALFLSMALLSLGAKKCKKDPAVSVAGCYKGRLEVKGICANYTVKLLEGNLDTAKLVTNWKDEVTGKTYSNVFGLGSPCTFPEKLAAGDEFYFTLSNEGQSCNVCLAYYPTPPKKLSIKVLDGPCK